MRQILATTLILSGLIVPTRVLSQRIMVEAEWYTDFKDLGGSLIRRVECHYANNDSAVDYVDVPGEWIRLDVTFPEDGDYLNVLCCAGLEDSVSVIHLILNSDELRDEQVSEVQTLGEGIG